MIVGQRWQGFTCPPPTKLFSVPSVAGMLNVSEGEWPQKAQKTQKKMIELSVFGFGGKEPGMPGELGCGRFGFQIYRYLFFFVIWHVECECMD